jgi:hypothetical protein
VPLKAQRIQKNATDENPRVLPSNVHRAAALFLLDVVTGGYGGLLMTPDDDCRAERRVAYV